MENQKKRIYPQKKVEVKPIQNNPVESGHSKIIELINADLNRIQCDFVVNKKLSREDKASLASYLRVLQDIREAEIRRAEKSNSGMSQDEFEKMIEEMGYVKLSDIQQKSIEEIKDSYLKK